MLFASPTKGMEILDVGIQTPGVRTPWRRSDNPPWWLLRNPEYRSMPDFAQARASNASSSFELQSTTFLQLSNTLVWQLDLPGPLQGLPLCKQEDSHLSCNKQRYILEHSRCIWLAPPLPKVHDQAPSSRKPFKTIVLHKIGFARGKGRNLLFFLPAFARSSCECILNLDCLLQRAFRVLEIVRMESHKTFKQLLEKIIGFLTALHGSCKLRSYGESKKSLQKIPKSRVNGIPFGNHW